MKQSKAEKMIQLAKMGLNVPDCIMIRPNYPINEFAYSFVNRHKRISIRADFPDEKWRTPPHLPNVPNSENTLKVIKKLHDEGWIITIQEGINPKETIVCGTILKRYGDPDDGKTYYEFEVAFGPGTVRRVMVDGDIEARWICVEDGDNIFANQITKEAMKALRKLPTNKIYEFSYYARKLGRKKQNLIFWEVLDAKL